MDRQTDRSTYTGCSWTGTSVVGSISARDRIWPDKQALLCRRPGTPKRCVTKRSLFGHTRHLVTHLLFATCFLFEAWIDCGLRENTTKAVYAVRIVTQNACGAPVLGICSVLSFFNTRSSNHANTQACATRSHNHICPSVLLSALMELHTARVSSPAGVAFPHGSTQEAPNVYWIPTRKKASQHAMRFATDSN